MQALEKKLDELFTYLKDNMVTKTEFEEGMDEIDDRLEKIEGRLDGFERRLDTMADQLRPMEQLEKLITEDVLDRLKRVEKELFHS